jgi:hypothetical protein
MLRPFVLDREVKAECDAKFAKSANEAEHLHTYVDLLALTLHDRGVR